MNENIKKFMSFLDNTPSGYHAAFNLFRLMQAEGYQQLSEHEDWTLLPGGKPQVAPVDMGVGQVEGVVPIPGSMLKVRIENGKTTIG